MSILEILQQPSVLLPEQYRKMSRESLEQRVREVKVQLGDELFIPGHHYQRDEVIQFADAVGDSLQLAQQSANNQKAKYIVFCGVHFMAETADILTQEEQTVILPDMRAGCSMADMADIAQTEIAWEHLQTIFGETILPLTYVNSTAAIKAFVGRHDGATVTSSNAHKMVKWALQQKERILFLPDQHLGRNTAYDLGIPLEEMAVWDPIKRQLIASVESERIKVILWKGHCSVHENFTVDHIVSIRKKYPKMKVIVHPECPREVVALSDDNGSTKYIIEQVQHAPPGSEWAIGTEMNLVNRLIQQHPEQKIISLNPNMCPCLTMNRIDLPHLVWSLDQIVSGDIRNEIRVDRETTRDAVTALQRMLERSS